MSAYSRIAGVLLAAAGTVLTTAAPAFAEDGPDAGGAAGAANWSFDAASVCFQELAVVPVGGPWTGDSANHCANGNVLDHSRG